MRGPVIWNVPHKTAHKTSGLSRKSVDADMDGPHSPTWGEVAHSTIEVSCKAAKTTIADLKS